MIKYIKENFQRPQNGLKQIIIINVLAFLVLLTINLIEKFIIGPQEIESYLSVSPQWANFKPWTLFTYSFVTQYPLTLLYNMFLLNTFGNITVSLLGNNRLITLYVFGTIAGGIAFLLAYNFVPFFIEEAANTPKLIGVSAGIYAVMVGAATFAPNFSFFLFPFISVRLKYIVIFVLVGTLANLSYGESYGVIIAQLGGALWGYFYIWYLRLPSMSSWKPWTFWTRMRTKFKKNTFSLSQKKGEKKKRKNRQTSQKEIDIILDKISTHGYKYLTDEEKQSLFNAGK